MKSNPDCAMRYFLHFLILLPLFTPVIVAQSPAGRTAGREEPPPTRSLAVCYLFAQEIPRFYFRDAEGEPQLLRMERERFTTWNVIPVGTEFQLYRKTADPEGNDLYEPVTTWSLPAGAEPVRRLFYIRPDRSIGSYDFTDPPGKHPPLGIRAINLTDNPVVLSLDDITETLPAYSEKMYSAPADTHVRFKFQYGAQDTSGRVRISPVSNLRFRSERQRMTLIFGLKPEFETRQNTRDFLGFSVNAIRIYDVLSPTAP